jgi:formate/nitrite transporter FocA (FNT family)
MLSSRNTQDSDIQYMSSSSDETTTGQTAYEDILAQQIEKGQIELERRNDGLFLSALSAGLDMGFGPLLMAVMLTLVSGVYGEPLTDILLANLYSIGFIFIILGRSELFTEHTTLAVFPVLNRQAGLKDLGRLWSIVFIGNVIGGVVFAGFAVFYTPSGLVEPVAFVNLAQTYIKQSTGVLFAGAILAGWLMGLLSWLIASAQDSIGRIFVVWLITATISFAHFPHCIAGTIEVLMGTFASPSISLLDYGRFLLLTTIGNIIGGTFFVALLRYSHVTRSAE